MAGGWRDQRGVKGDSRVEASLFSQGNCNLVFVQKARGGNLRRQENERCQREKVIGKQGKQEEINSWALREGEVLPLKQEKRNFEKCRKDRLAVRRTKRHIGRC